MFFSKFYSAFNNWEILHTIINITLILKIRRLRGLDLKTNQNENIINNTGQKCPVELVKKLHWKKSEAVRCNRE